MWGEWNPRVPLEKVDWPEFDRAGWEVGIRREDLIHPWVSGNKFRKLKYNLLQARDLGCRSLLTLGGAHSNHILAVASLAGECGFESVGWIRGEELDAGSNDTLRQASEQGMRLNFVSRGLYRALRTAPWAALCGAEALNSSSWAEELMALRSNLDRPLQEIYFLPEGGTNLLAVLGCSEILLPEDERFDWICCPVGTGGTVAGLSRAARPDQRVLGFSAIRGTTELRSVISKFTPKSNWGLTDAYVQGGYGRVGEELVDFMNRFHGRGNCLLDPIYTGKMLFGLDRMARERVWGQGTRVLLVHTGGLQGIRGINRKRERLGLSLIQTE